VTKKTQEMAHLVEVAIVLMLHTVPNKNTFN